MMIILLQQLISEEKMEAWRGAVTFPEHTCIQATLTPRLYMGWSLTYGTAGLGPIELP